MAMRRLSEPPDVRALGNVPMRAPVVVYGDDDLRRTLSIMVRLINRDATQPWVILAAREACAGANLGQPNTEAREVATMRAICNWVRKHIAFVMDPHANGRYHEVLADSENVLRSRVGDCDEHAVLTGAMNKAAGIRRIRLWVGGPRKPGTMRWVPQHVWSAGTTRGRREINLDTTLPGRPFGSLPGPGFPRWVYAHWNEVC